jgi:hypothetical protein
MDLLINIYMLTDASLFPTPSPSYHYAIILNIAKKKSRTDSIVLEIGAWLLLHANYNNNGAAETMGS